jgi:hypothetical protein
MLLLLSQVGSFFGDRYKLPALRSMPIDWMIFSWVYLLWRQRKCCYRNFILRCLFIGYSFSDILCVTTWNVSLFLPMIQKRTNIKTLDNLIYTRGRRPLVQIRYPRVSMLLLIKWDCTVWFTITYNALFKNKTTHK